MGLYVNPKDKTKEEWLEKHGIVISHERKWQDFDEDLLPVVLIDNGIFKAAGVAYSEEEYNVFMEFDGRIKTVYSVTKKDLMEVTDGELKSYLSI